MTAHELKCWPEPFAAILSGEKRHEVRKNDRGYAVGDVLHLREWDPRESNRGGPLSLRHCVAPPEGYTGRELRACVTHLTPGGSWGLPADLCVMSIELVGRETFTREQIASALREASPAIQGDAIAHAQFRTLARVRELLGIVTPKKEQTW